MITETIEWVPVEERMPEAYQDVFVTKLGDASVPISRAIWDKVQQIWHDGWYDGWHDRWGAIDHPVTHWAEIKGPERRQKED